MNTTREPVVPDDPGTLVGAPGPKASTDATFDGGGEMGPLMRSFDWSKTPLGPVSEWSQALKTTVGILLRSPSPMYLAWGCLGRRGASWWSRMGKTSGMGYTRF